MSAIDGSIQKKIHGSGATKGAGVKLIIEQEDTGILLKGVSKNIKNETKEQRGGFLSMLLGTLGASLLGNLRYNESRRREHNEQSQRRRNSTCR